MINTAHNRFQLALLACLACQTAIAATGPQDQVRAVVDREYPSLFELYKHLHSHPELSFQEKETSARLAEELRKAGFEVTTGVGKYGVVGLLLNGQGPTVLVRTDLDGLPVNEQTGLPYASIVTTKNAR